MRYALVVLTFLFVGSSVSGQALDGAQIIQRIMDSGGSEGHDQKIIGGMGDAAAVIITKILAGRSIRSNDIDNVLLVLNSSFADPRFVTSTSDREPRTAFFVLRCLDLSTNDPKLKQRIAETRERIQGNFARSEQPGSPKN